MKKINVTQSSIAPYDEYISEIKSIWDTKWLTNMGEKHELLQEELAKYLDVNYLRLCVNGHSALEVAIQAEKLSGEIITTPFTFISTTNAIIRSGCTPVFCDIDKKTYTIDANKIEGLITDRTSAILAVHVYGNACEMEKIEEIAKKRKIKVIYDAAHSFGTKYKGKGIANYGDISIFSFHATKVFNTIEGGAICTKDRGIAEQIKYIRDFGIVGAENVEYVGPNAKMNEFCAAMGLCNLRHVDNEIRKRSYVYERYVEKLKNISGIILPIVQENVEKNYAYFPIVVDEKIYGISRDDLCELLMENNIYARKYFYPLTNEFECLLKCSQKGNTPVAQYISKRVMTLPMYADLTIEEVDYICEIIRRKK